MPDNDPEPENYSIDDMMDRLRTRGGGPRDGEAKLVVREDGTQAYKMRKRKRRSHQPKKEKEKRDQRFRVAQVVAAVALVAGAGLAVLGSVVYLNSPGYHATIKERIRTWTGAEPELIQFRVTPINASAGAIELVWPEGSMLQTLKASGVKGDLQMPSLLGGKWKGAEMIASNGGTLVVRRGAGSAPPQVPAPSGECPFQFRFRSPNFNVLMGDAESPAVRLRGTEASLVVLDSAATSSNLQFEGGLLQVTGWGDFAMKFASLQFEPAGIRVGNVRLAPDKESKGEIEILNPHQAVVDLNGGQTELAIRLQRMPLARLLGPSFGTWLDAEVETPEGGRDGSITFKTGAVPSFSCRVPFRATATSDSRNALLPLYGIIAGQLGEPWYGAPVFDADTSGTLVRDSGSTGVEDLRLEARNRFIITGKIMADTGGNLKGTVEIGLPQGLARSAGTPFSGVFKRLDGGYAWATVNISGTGRQPQDDLQKQLDAAATAAPAAGDKESQEEAFRELTNPERK